MTALTLTACRYGCGFAGTADDLSTHERQDHHGCLCCGQQPADGWPVQHLSDCMRAAVTS